MNTQDYECPACEGMVPIPFDCPLDYKCECPECHAPLLFVHEGDADDEGYQIDASYLLEVKS